MAVETNIFFRERRGFSAIELVVAMGIFALLVTFAVVAQSRLLPHYRLSAGTRQVVTDLRLLRGKAIAQNMTFRMVFAANSNTYRAERFNPGTNAFDNYALYVRGSTTAGSPQPIELPSTVQTTAAVTVTFEPRGTVTTTAPITLSAPGPRTRSLSINLAGLITIT
jgi:prepilin-type N-terminal cleavage/methylation domain-containing protein